jgi:hypothetical protein
MPNKWMVSEISYFGYVYLLILDMCILFWICVSYFGYVYLLILDMRILFWICVSYFGYVYLLIFL